MIQKILVVRLLTMALALFFIQTLVQAQNNMGIGTNSPHPSAALEVSSTTQGMLVPCMTMAQRNLIAAPAVGLIVYQTNNTPGYYYYNGSIWVSFMGATGVQGATGTQGITGNAGVNGIDGVSVPVGGTAGQVLAKINATDYIMEWVTPGSGSTSGGKLVWEGIATVSQTVPLGALTTAASTIIFNNDVTGPTNGGTILSDSVFVVGEPGLYCITAHVISFQSSASGAGASTSPYVEIKNAAGANTRQYFGTGITNNATTNISTLPFASRGRSFATAWAQLATGETVRIRVNNVSIVNTAPITTDGTTRISIVKY
jgi:hypothetical protein